VPLRQGEAGGGGRSDVEMFRRGVAHGQLVGRALRNPKRRKELSVAASLAAPEVTDKAVFHRLFEHGVGVMGDAEQGQGHRLAREIADLTHESHYDNLWGGTYSAAAAGQVASFGGGTAFLCPAQGRRREPLWQHGCGGIGVGDRQRRAAVMRDRRPWLDGLGRGVGGVGIWGGASGRRGKSSPIHAPGCWFSVSTLFQLKLLRHSGRLSEGSRHGRYLAASTDLQNKTEHTIKSSRPPQSCATKGPRPSLQQRLSRRMCRRGRCIASY